MGKFQLFQDKSESYRFRLLAGNGQVILSSQSYASRAGVENGIFAVRKHSQIDEQFDREEAKNGSPYFTLKAGNGQIIGSSEMYSSNSAMENGIMSVKKNAPDAEIVDLTDGEESKPEPKKTKLTDTDRINFLQSLTKGYGLGWMLRESGFGRGMRLHETTQEGATPDVRQAIDKFYNKLHNLNSEVEYTYEVLIEEDDIFPAGTWIPITTDRIKNPENIDKYIEKGILKKINR